MRESNGEMPKRSKNAPVEIDREARELGRRDAKRDGSETKQRLTASTGTKD